MGRLILLSIPVFLAIVFCTSCASLVYSPSINLTTKPLKEKEIDLQGCVELLPETRPEELEGNPTTFGLSGQLSYGFNDKFNMTAKGWVDLEEGDNALRSGYALNAQFLKTLDEQSRLIVLPRVGMALNGSEISGYGLSASVIYQNSTSNTFSWYGGIGLLWGFKQLDKQTNSENAEKLPMGFGILGNAGLGWQVADHIRLNCELNPLYQINTFDGNTQLLLSPSIGLGYTINRKD